MPEIRFHDLRHTCATLLLTRNVNPKIVSELLRHATIAIPIDTYSHVLPNMERGMDPQELPVNPETMVEILYYLDKVKKHGADE